jgi:hypothetical protein
MNDIDIFLNELATIQFQELFPMKNAPITTHALFFERLPILYDDCYCMS